MDTPRSVTELLKLAGDGDPDAHQALVQRLYHELHALAGMYLAGERTPRITLQTTVLINETYVKLFGHGAGEYSSRGHFFAAAGQAMRQVLVEYARKRNALKRGGGVRPVELVDALAASAVDLDPEASLALNEAMTALANEHPRWAKVVEMRFYAELTVAQTAEALGVSDRQVEKDWSMARAWLFRALSDE